MADLTQQAPYNYGALLTAETPALVAQQQANTGQMTALSELPQRQAQTALLGAQTTGADLQNQITGMKVKAYQQALAGQELNAGAPTQVAEQPGVFDPDAESAKMDQAFEQQYRVNPGYTPGEMAQITSAIPLAKLGEPGMMDAAMKMREIRVQNETAAKQIAAQKAYDTSYSLATSPDGLAYANMSKVAPQQAAALAKSMGLDPDPANWTPAQAKQVDQHVRDYATMANSKLMKFTGDKEEDKNGLTVNSRTGNKTIGTQEQTISPNEKAKLFNEGSEHITIEQSDGSKKDTTRAKFNGYSDAEAYAAAGGKPASGSPAASGAKIVPAGGAGAAKPAAAGGGQKIDPALKEALSDTSYDLDQTPVRTGVSATPGAIEQQKAVVEKRKELSEDQKALVKSSSQGLLYSQAAQKILEGKGAPLTGPFGPVMARISAVFGGLDASNYQEVAKYLANNSIQQFQGNFGSRPANAEFQIQFKTASPNAEMTPTALKDILNFNTKQFQYGLDTAHHITAYASDLKKNPQYFYDWNQQHFPLESINGAPPPVRPGQATSGPAPETAKPMPQGAKLTAYAVQHFGGDEAKAAAFLKSHGYQ